MAYLVDPVINVFGSRLYSEFYNNNNEVASDCVKANWFEGIYFIHLNIPTGCWVT